MANRMKYGNKIGWLGLFFVFLVAPSQLYKSITTGSVEDVSLPMYLFLWAGLICYLIHAITIKSKVFICSQLVNLVTVTWMIVLLLMYLIGG